MNDKPTYAELLAVAREYREACCAAMRVLADLDIGTFIGAPAESYQQRFIDELHSLGITDGFGKRCDEILKRAAQA